MGRVLGLIGAILVVALVVFWALSIEGSSRIEFDGRVVDPPTSALIVLLLVAAALIVFGTAILGWLGRLPGRIRNRRADRQRNRGMTALTRGLEAVAAGDAEDAQHHARLANRNLDNAALTRLLTAQAAQLAGDDATARESYAAMLDAPETEFLGLRGLYLQAMHDEDRTLAKAYADRAFRLRPGAPWAFQSVYDLSLEHGQWGDAYEALRLSQRQGPTDAEGAARRAAALLTARAYAAMDAGDEPAAREDAADALKADPGLAPAAVLSARLDARASKGSRAAKTIEAAWARAPHPALLLVMRELTEAASPKRRQARLHRLADKNPGHPESELLLAQLLVEEGRHAEARAKLEPLLLGEPTARTFAVMADAMEGLYGRTAAEPWLERAARAPREATLGTDGRFSLTTEGWQRLVREYGEHGRLAPPPLEVTETGLDREELTALTAPRPDVAEAPIVERIDATVIAEDEDGGGEPQVDEAETVEVLPEEEAPSTEPHRAHRRRRFASPFRTSEAEAEAEIDGTVGPAVAEDEDFTRPDVVPSRSE